MKKYLIVLFMIFLTSTPVLAQEVNSIFQEGQSVLMEQVTKANPLIGGSTWDAPAKGMIRGDDIKNNLPDPVVSWDHMRTSEVSSTTEDGVNPIEENSMDTEELKAVVPASADIKRVNYPTFQPHRGVDDVMRQTYLTDVYNDAARGPIALWNIAMMQTEPAIGAGVHNSILQAGQATANTMRGVRLMHDTLPGDKEHRDIMLRSYMGCVSGHNSTAQANVFAYNDCLNDITGREPVPFNFSNSPDGRDRTPGDDLMEDMRLSDILFSEVIENSTGDAETRYRRTKADFVKWFGDIRFHQEEDPAMPGLRRLNEQFVTHGADMVQIHREITRDRYYLLVSLVYIGCVGKNLQGAEIWGGRAIMYPDNYVFNTQSVTGTILNPGARTGAWGGFDGDAYASTGAIPQGNYIPDLGSGDADHIWSEWVNKELIRRLGYPEMPLRAAVLDGFVDLYMAKKAKELTGGYGSKTVQTPQQICEAVHPQHTARLRNHDTFTTELDYLNFYYRYAEFVAVSQVVRAIIEAVVAISELRNVEDFYKQKAYELVESKIGTSDFQQLHIANVTRHKQLVDKTFRYLARISGSKGKSLTTVSKQKVADNTGGGAS